VFADPVVLIPSDDTPAAVLLLPLVFEYSVYAPAAVFCTPLDNDHSAPPPTAVFDPASLPTESGGWAVAVARTPKAVATRPTSRIFIVITCTPSQVFAFVPEARNVNPPLSLAIYPISRPFVTYGGVVPILRIGFQE
jgi:hypothetical protein